MFQPPRKAMKPSSNEIHGILARRLREVRRDLFGEHGGAMLAEFLRLPNRSWMNYESGVAIPAAVLLRFLEITGVSAHWLLTGQGPKYARSPAGAGGDRGTARIPWGRGEPGPG
jgi:hypothetical protein